MVLPRELEQAMHVSHALTSARLQRQQRLVMRFTQHRFEAVRNRSLPHEHTPAFERAEKTLQLGARTCGHGPSISCFSEIELAYRAHKRRMLVAIRAFDAHGCEFFIGGHGDERQTQHGRERNVLQRVVEQPEQSSKDLDLDGQNKILRAPATNGTSARLNSFANVSTRDDGDRSSTTMSRHSTDRIAFLSSSQIWWPLSCSSRSRRATRSACFRRREHPPPKCLVLSRYRHCPAYQTRWSRHHYSWHRQ